MNATRMPKIIVCVLSVAILADASQCSIAAATDTGCNALAVDLSHGELDASGLPLTFHVALTNASARRIVGGNFRMELFVNERALDYHAIASERGWAEFRLSPGESLTLILPFRSMVFVDSHGSQWSRAAAIRQLLGHAWWVRARLTDETGHNPDQCGAVVHAWSNRLAFAPKGGKQGEE